MCHRIGTVAVVWVIFVAASTAAAQETEPTAAQEAEPAAAQEPDPLHPLPFLEPTDLYWALEENPFRPFRVGAQNLLEADVFPHFVLGFSSRCRADAPEPLSAWWPCISVTPAVRLRMGRDVSAPIHSPSFMPRLNAQWLLYGKDDDDAMQGVTVQMGHHSNGQTGCLFLWVNPTEDRGMCADEALSEGQPIELNEFIDYGEIIYRRPRIVADTRDGNFSLNFIRATYDNATYDLLNGVGGRFSLGIEWNPDVWMFEAMRSPNSDVVLEEGISLEYPNWRFILGFEVAFPDVPVCRRFDASFRFKSSVTFKFQGTCVWSEERGLGGFVRAYAGSDEYNSSYFGSEVARVEVGFTINRLRVFGADY